MGTGADEKQTCRAQLPLLNLVSLTHFIFLCIRSTTPQQDCKDAVDAYLAAIKGGAGTALLNAGPPADRA